MIPPKRQIELIRRVRASGPSKPESTPHEEDAPEIPPFREATEPSVSLEDKYSYNDDRASFGGSIVKQTTLPGVHGMLSMESSFEEVSISELQKEFFCDPPQVHSVDCTSPSTDSSTTLLNELTDEVRTVMSGIEKISTFAEMQEKIMALAPFELNGTACLASGSDDYSIKLWDLQCNTLIATLEGHMDEHTA